MREPLTVEQQVMVEANTGLVGFVLNRRRTPPEEWDDAFQDGLLGLMRATQKFDPDRGFKFSTYALFWIRQGIQKGVRDFEGRSYRAAADGRGEWAPAMSLDVVIETDSGHAITFADAVLVDDDDPGDQALRDSEAALLVSLAMGLCRDDLDRAAVLAVAQGTPWSKVAAEFGVSKETPRNRWKWIQGRLRHPSMHDRIGAVAS